MSTHSIETFALSYSFGPRAVLSGIDLKVPAGAVYGFLGPNGAGKTTTIRLLLGLLRGGSGTLRLFGLPIEKNLRTILGRTGALVESPSLYRHLTGRENLEVRRVLSGLPKSAISRALELVKLSDEGDRLVSTYSLGMRQRLGLAQALLAEPQLLILDEPTNGLDPAGIQEMRELLRRLPLEHGITVFLSSHLLSEVEQVATHIGILADGRLRFQGTASELRERQQQVLRVDLDRPADAEKLLHGAAWRVIRCGSGHLLIDTNRNLDAAAVNRLLITSGFEVSSLRFEQPSLEQMFLQLTQEAQA